MAQGSRERWLGAAAIGIGVLVCTSISGCQNTDKAPDPKTTTKQGLPTLPTTNTGATNTNKSVQPNGTFNGANLQPGGSVSGLPTSGTGQQQFASVGQSPYNTNGGMNPLKSAPQNPVPSTVGGVSQGVISPPAQPGIQQTGGLSTSGPSASNFANDPPPPSLPGSLPVGGLPLPPAPPSSPPSFNSNVSAPIAPPPLNPSAPSSGWGPSSTSPSGR